MKTHKILIQLSEEEHAALVARASQVGKTKTATAKALVVSGIKGDANAE